jgi:hypothetical protein
MKVVKKVRINKSQPPPAPQTSSQKKSKLNSRTKPAAIRRGFCRLGALSKGLMSTIVNKDPKFVD